MFYPKIQSLWKRDMSKKGIIIPGELSMPEFGSINHWNVTEKIDGMNVRVIYDHKEEKVTFNGRTDRAQMPVNLMKSLHAQFNYPHMASQLGLDKLTLFGEGYGAGIQKGGGYIKEDQDFILFDVYNWNHDYWLPCEDVMTMAKTLHIKCVPWIGVMSTDDAIEEAKSLFCSSISEDKNKKAEGIVATSCPHLFNARGHRIRWKLKAKDFEHLEQMEAQERKENNKQNEGLVDALQLS